MLFIDMDGVIANFNKGYLDLIGSDTPWHNFGYGIGHQLYGHGHEKVEELVYEKGFTFWARLEKLPWADTFIEFTETESPEFRFLSAPMSIDYNSYSGKAYWIQKHFPHLIDNLILCSADSKHLLAKSESDILIDDRETTIKAWDAAGGTGVLFDTREAYLNKRYAPEILDRVRDLIRTGPQS